jgi:hypothetical protein
MAELLMLPLLDLSATEIPSDILQSLTTKVVFRKRIVPIAREGNILRVATCDPFDLYAMDDVRMTTGLQIDTVLAIKDDIEKLIKTHYGLGGDTLDELAANDDEPSGPVSGGSEDLLELAQEASVIRLVNEIIVEAVHERASDIHIEPYEHQMAIRYRIDGILHEASVPPQMNRFQAAIISRIKILANLNIAERRIPQDGRIKFNVGGRQIDVRVSVIPMLFGEGVVMRLLDKANVLFTLPQLGMDPETYGRFRGLIERPHGIVLVTGPTGSGKTTTLYASLNEIVGPTLKVLTVEDPVEYHLQGVNQIPVDHKVGMTFGDASTHEHAAAEAKRELEAELRGGGDEAAARGEPTSSAVGFVEDEGRAAEVEDTEQADAEALVEVEREFETESGADDFGGGGRDDSAAGEGFEVGDLDAQRAAGLNRGAHQRRGDADARSLLLSPSPLAACRVGAGIRARLLC